MNLLFRIIITIIKALNSKKEPTDDEKRMIELLNSDENYVCKENTAEFMNWYKKNK